MDCRNNPCDFALDLKGQRTQGRCFCWDGLPSVSPDDRRAIRGAMQGARDRIAALESQLADASAEIARLRKALVWAARHGVFLNAEMSDVSPVLGYWPDARFGGEPELDLCPGTDASLIDVLCRLAEGE